MYRNSGSSVCLRGSYSVVIGDTSAIEGCYNMVDMRALEDARARGSLAIECSCLDGGIFRTVLRIVSGRAQALSMLNGKKKKDSEKDPGRRCCASVHEACRQLLCGSHDSHWG